MIDSGDCRWTDGWLPDRISVGVLTRAFPPELVDEAIELTGTCEQRRRLSLVRLMVYFVLALRLFRGRNCGCGQGARGAGREHRAAGHRDTARTAYLGHPEQPPGE
jgi:hypothetical protein